MEDEQSLNKDKKEERDVVPPVIKINFIFQNSSLGLEIFLVIERYYSYVYFIIILLLFVYKKLTYGPSYPTGFCALDVLLAIIFFVFMLFHLKLASMGNKIEHTLLLIIAVVFEIISIIGYIYLALLQTYINYYDFWFSIVGLILNGLVFIFTLYALFNVASGAKIK